MHDSQYDCQLHFVAVSECHPVIGDLPDRVQAKHAHALVVLEFCLSSFCDIVATAKQAKVKSEEFVVDESTIAHPEDDGPPPLVGLKVYHSTHSQQHMTHITEHHPHEEAESDQIESSRIKLLVAGDAIGIDDLLWNLHHFACWE